jgi:hypothetical protein
LRRMQPDSLWPEPSANPCGSEVVHRWEALLSKSPRLRPCIDGLLGRHRLRLQQTGKGRGEVEQTLWLELSRWLPDFEALPEFAVSAIAVTLEDDALRESDAHPFEELELPGLVSPEHAFGELETLLSDAAFALAFHCVDARLRPQLAAPELARVPEADWFGLLHAGARPQPVLTARVAVTLVLRVLSPGWSRHPARSRTAALRLFLARPEDVGGDLARLREALPPAWALSPEQAPAFVAAAVRARAALDDASGLCARFVAAARKRPGGLALLAAEGALPAAPEELAALFRNVRKYGHMGGFRQLLSAF